MARQLGLVPGVNVFTYLLAQKLNLVVQMLELELRVFISYSPGLKVCNLLFNALQLALCFNGWIQTVAPRYCKNGTTVLRSQLKLINHPDGTAAA